MAKRIQAVRRSYVAAKFETEAKAAEVAAELRERGLEAEATEDEVTLTFAGADPETCAKHDRALCEAGGFVFSSGWAEEEVHLSHSVWFSACGSREFGRRESSRKTEVTCPACLAFAKEAPRVRLRQVGGDDGYCWCVFVDGRLAADGMTRRSADAEKRRIVWTLAGRK